MKWTVYEIEGQMHVARAMHDPMTQAFQINQFWRKANDWGYKPPLITVWHVDPERDGSDDSCDWFGTKSRLNAKEKAFADRLIDNEYDNLRNWFSQFVPESCPTHGDNHEDCDLNDKRCRYGEFVETCDREEMRWRIKRMIALYKREFTWRWHPRWHFWHWKLQIHPLQSFKRWAFSRCCKCGKGFRWGSEVIGYSWDSTGPLWFRSEKQIAHIDCDRRNIVQHMAGQATT